MKGAYFVTGTQGPKIIVAHSIDEALKRAGRAWRDTIWSEAKWLGDVLEYADMPDVPQPQD